MGALYLMKVVKDMKVKTKETTLEAALEMYREGYSREQILSKLGTKYLSKSSLDEICDAEDRLWDAKD